MAAPQIGPGVPDPGKVLPLWKTPDDWWILQIHYSAVPGYDFEAATQGLSEDGIRQEMEIDWTATKGKRVYPTFGFQRHVSLEPIPFNPREPLFCGWDFGNTPAFVPTQLNRYGQWCIYPGVHPTEDHVVGTYEFGLMVAEHLQRFFATPHDLDLNELRLIHYGDPMVNSKPATTESSRKEARTHAEILNRGILVPIGVDHNNRQVFKERKGWGWHIKPGAVEIPKRLESVRARLDTTLKGGLSALVVDKRATVVIEGFQGAYCYAQHADGTYDREPDKNYWSHTMDAMGYIATRLFGAKKVDEDDQRKQGRRFRSRAANRYA